MLIVPVLEEAVVEKRLWLLHIRRRVVHTRATQEVEVAKEKVSVESVDQREVFSRHSK